MKPVKRIQLKCKLCGILFSPKSSRSKGYFCSRYCYGKSKEKIIKTSCSFCGKEIFKNPNQVRRYKNQYCSQECFHKGNRGRKVYNFKGGTISKNGYRIIQINSKRILEHRYIMEQHLCRKLLDSEIVHHLNGNKLDNRLENLQITKREDHIEIHRSKQWSVEHDKCIKCGTVSIKHEGHGFCEKCYKTPYKKRNTGPKWSLKFDRCIECGQTSSRHEGKGVCNRCTQRKKSKKTMK